MKYAFGIAFIVLAFCGPVIAAGAPAAVYPAAEASGMGTTAPARSPGTMLLDGLADLFLVPYGSGDELETRLDTLMKQARLSLERREIPLPFYTRFQRMLGLSRLVTLKDPEGVIKPTMQALVDEFIQEIIGVEPGSDKLPHIATALEEEIVSLQIYLDTLKTRQELLMGLRGKPPPPPPAKKK